MEIAKQPNISFWVTMWIGEVFQLRFYSWFWEWSCPDLARWLCSEAITNADNSPHTLTSDSNVLLSSWRSEQVQSRSIRLDDGDVRFDSSGLFAEQEVYLRSWWYFSRSEGGILGSI